MLKRKIFVEKLIYFNLKYQKSYNYEILTNSSDDFSLKEGLLKKNNFKTVFIETPVSLYFSYKVKRLQNLIADLIEN